MPVHLEQTGKSDALVCPVKVIDLTRRDILMTTFLDYKYSVVTSTNVLNNPRMRN
jgi:hypothetical protein